MLQSIHLKANHVGFQIWDPSKSDMLLVTSFLWKITSPVQSSHCFLYIRGIEAPPMLTFISELCAILLLI